MSYGIHSVSVREHKEELWERIMHCTTEQDAEREVNHYRDEVRQYVASRDALNAAAEAIRACRAYIGGPAHRQHLNDCFYSYGA